MHDLVVWCVVSKIDVYSHSMPLSSYIYNAQYKLSIPAQYCIDKSEWDTVDFIIAEFQKELVQNYFCGKLILPKSKYVIPGDHYFMFALQSFLNDHQCDYDFQGNAMHKERLSYKRYGDWGGPCYDATYSLTDFALVYHKLYYVAYLSSKSSKIFNPKGVAFQNSESIKSTLDTKQIQISRY